VYTELFYTLETAKNKFEANLSFKVNLLLCIVYKFLR